MTAPTGDPMVGRTIAHYEVLTRIGGGGMGVVYRARDTRLGRIVALKFLPQQWSHDEDARQRFIREAQAASATNHQNICTIHDVETADDGQLCIVMAYYEGQTLKQRLASGPLPVEDALDIATQIADGLAKAHAQGVVHRDVKPGNVMLTEDGVRILDFGLATFADALKLTVEHSTLGTAAYMSPEQVRGQSADARSDVWAVGVMLYEMLTGHVPFQGSHAEAIAYAVRHETPLPMKASRPEVGEEVEQLVFRSMHKQQEVRFANGRDLARALRQLRGQSLPLDLRTQPVPLPHPRPILDASRRTHWKGRAGIAAALIVGVAAVSAWLAWPIERTQVAILPVVNQTGDRELDEYRLALTYELVGRLSESASVRVWPYERMLPILRRFRARDDDVSSLASSGAITEHSGATTIIVPTLIYEDRRWKGRIELRSAATGATEGTYETEPQVSALATETSRALMATMASRVEEHFIRTAPFGADAKVRLRRLLGREVAAPGGRRWRTLDVVAAFEKGLNAFGDLEYATAAGFFATASQLDATNSLVHAWHSRALRMMRSDEESTQAADLALRTLTEDTPTQDRLLVEAIASEARNAMTAESRYRALVDRDRDDVNAMMELAAFFDRQGRNDEAVEAYTGALTIDAHAYTADIELCRMYNRLGQSLMARERAARARTTFQNLRAPSYEAHALMCLADSLRSGGASELREARQAATGALSLFEQLGAVYNIPRAFNYLATIAGLQRNRGEALAFGEQALAAARSGSNIVIQPLVLMNLGVTSSAIGDHGRAAEYYQESYTRYRALGDQARAAEIQANRGALLIDFGPNPADGLREVENALEVVTEQRNNDFEAFCLEVIARYYRAAGLRSQAESYLNRARSIARQFGFQDKVASADIQSGRVALEAADYTPALDRLGEGLQASADVGLRAEGLIHLSRVRARIGDFDGARSELAKVPGALEGRDFHLLPILHFAQGELAFEMNRLADAKASFEEAASASGGDLPDPVSVEAAAYVGLLDALAGQRAGRRAIESCRDYALMMGRKPLEARCRVFLARLLVEAGSYRDALTTLGAIPEDDTRFTIGAELRAQVHYWRKRAFIGLHDFEAAEMEGRSALQLIETTRRSVPEEFRSAFDSRPEIRRTLS